MYTSKNRDKIIKKWFSGPKTVKKCRSVSGCPSEHDEQCQFVRWLDDRGYKFSSIPNASKISYNMANRNTAEGLRAGLPDLLVIVGGQLVWIEMKKIDRKPVKGGKGGVSEDQREWIDILNGCKNCSAYVCYGCGEAVAVIEGIDKVSMV